MSHRYLWSYLLLCVVCIYGQYHQQSPYCKRDYVPEYIAHNNTYICRYIKPSEIIAGMKWLVDQPVSSACTGNVIVHEGFHVCDSELPTYEGMVYVYMYNNNKEQCVLRTPVGEYWLSRGYFVRYIFPGFPVKCTKQFHSQKKRGERISFHRSLPENDEEVHMLFLEDDKGQSSFELAVMMSNWPGRRNVRQISMRLRYSCSVLQDLGFGTSTGWGLWSLHHFLRTAGFERFAVSSESGSTKSQPLCIKEVLQAAEIDPSKCCYYSSFIRNRPADLTLPATIHDYPAANFDSRLNAVLWNIASSDIPPYCALPVGANRTYELTSMYKWIWRELKYTCQIVQHSFPCTRTPIVNPLTPCMRSVASAMAEDYAWSKGWCHVSTGLSDIPELPDMESQAAQLVENGKEIDAMRDANKPALRLVFLITVYRDIEFVQRLLDKLYSPFHQYVIAVDKKQVSFVADMRSLVRSRYGRNVVVSDPYAVVYLASSATRILIHGMSWFLRRIPGWDYLVTLTGSDYPLIPLARMESILAARNPPMPSLMAWSLKSISSTKPLSLSPLAQHAAKVVFSERRGGVSHARGNSQFGLPLTCEGQSLLCRYNNRNAPKRWLTNDTFHSQWLFGKDIWRDNVNMNFVKEWSAPPVDNTFRVWHKSDPATTGVYDRESVEYIIRSSEGIKYYHFFKYMLVASEEHYWISLLGNWKRTIRFVNSIQSLAIWNTWRHGTLTYNTTKSRSKGDRSTHTSFLSTREIDILRGLNELGVFFARKFTSNQADVLDMIDDMIENDKSTKWLRTA